MAGILWVLFFLGGGGVGWLLAPDRQRERDCDVCVRVCVSVRGRSGQVKSGSVKVRYI